jgi:hypothetical protein
MSNNGMHPTRDTLLVINLRGVGGRVMPGVRLKLQMKLRAYTFCPIVAVVAASVIISCSMPGRSQPAEANLVRAIATPSPDKTKAENKPTLTIEGESYVSGDIKVGSS